MASLRVFIMSKDNILHFVIFCISIQPYNDSLGVAINNSLIFIVQLGMMKSKPLLDTRTAKTI